MLRTKDFKIILLTKLVATLLQLFNKHFLALTLTTYPPLSTPPSANNALEDLLNRVPLRFNKTQAVIFSRLGRTQYRAS